MATFIKSEESFASYDEILLKHAVSSPSSYDMESIITAYTAEHNPKLYTADPNPKLDLILMYIMSFLALVLAIAWARAYYLGQESSCEEFTEEDAKRSGRSSRRSSRRNVLTCFYGSSPSPSPPARRAMRVPPGPTWRRLPVIGHLHLLGPLPHRVLQKLSEIYGPILLIQLGIHPTVVISSPAMAKLFLHDYDHIFSGRPSMEFSHLAFYGQGSALLQPNPKWRLIRKLYTQELLRPKRVRAYRSIRDDEVSILVQKLRSAEPGRAVDIRAMAAEVIFNIMTRVLFSQRSSDEASLSEFPAVYWSISRLFAVPIIADFVPWLWWVDRFRSVRRRIKAEAKKMDVILTSILRSRLNQILEDPVKWERDGHKDMLSTFMVQYLGDGSALAMEDALKVLDYMNGCRICTPAGSNLEGLIENINTVKASLLEMLTGSTDTTAALVEWTMVEVLRAPDSARIMEKLQTELRGATKLMVTTTTTTTMAMVEEISSPNLQGHGHGHGVQVLEETTLSKLPYLQAVVKETMRLHPPAPLLIPHESMERAEVGGFAIPAKTRLIVNVWAIGRDQSIWGHNVAEFHPERFLPNNNNAYANPDPNAHIDGSSYELLAFGHGRRGCPGTRLGLSMATTLLANLLHSFNWEDKAAIPSTPHHGVKSMDEVLGTSISLRYPLMAIPSPT